ncbi:MAG: hypothetical protein ABI461_03840, partial [Polyangiaceae bacterium]
PTVVRSMPPRSTFEGVKVNGPVDASPLVAASLSLADPSLAAPLSLAGVPPSFEAADELLEQPPPNVAATHAALMRPMMLNERVELKQNDDAILDMNGLP